MLCGRMDGLPFATLHGITVELKGKQVAGFFGDIDFVGSVKDNTYVLMEPVFRFNQHLPAGSAWSDGRSCVFSVGLTCGNGYGTDRSFRVSGVCIEHGTSFGTGS